MNPRRRVGGDRRSPRGFALTDHLDAGSVLVLLAPLVSMALTGVLGERPAVHAGLAAYLLAGVVLLRLAPLLKAHGDRWLPHVRPSHRLAGGTTPDSDVSGGAR